MSSHTLEYIINVWVLVHLAVISENYKTIHIHMLLTIMTENF